MGAVGDGSGSNVSDGERWGLADEALLTGPPLTSCCASRFLIGGPGVGDACFIMCSSSHLLHALAPDFFFLMFQSLW